MADEPSTGQYVPESRLHEAIASFEQARDAGQDPNPQEWLARYPEVAAQLADFFADQEQLHRLAGPLRPPNGKVETFPDIPGYQILEVVGRGGMGVVYKARQLSADRIVALKVIRPDRLEGLSADERRKAIERFITEAQAAAKLEHESIVPVYEVGELGDLRGRPFYSMRYVVGTSLHALIRQGPLEGRRAARYLEKVARAVHEAHRHGILHRDLKPHNILLETNGDRPLVADFGLAKLLQGGRDVTGTGDVMGTPAYMSPEQAQGSANVTVATDVYGLGATLYAFLTGRPPFSSDDPVLTLRKVVEEDPLPPRAFNPRVHRDLETICLKCLEKEPRKRYADADELANRLAMFLENKPIPDRPISWLNRAARWIQRRPAAAGLIGASSLALLFLVGFVASSLYLKQREEVLGLTKQAKEQAEERELLEAKAKELAQDRARTEEQFKNKLDKYLYLNRVLLAQNEWQDNNLIRARQLLEQCPEYLRNWEWSYVRRLCESASVTFRNVPPPAAGVVFTGDGRWLAAASATTLTIWDSVTGQIMHTFEGDKNSYPFARFSPDGRRLARMGNNIIKVWDTESGEEVFAHQGSVSFFLSFSPDGKRLAWADYGQTVEVWDLETHQRTYSLQVPSGMQHLALSPTGQRLVTVSKDGRVAKVWDLSTSKEAFSLQGDIRFGAWQISYSPDGEHLVCSSGDGFIRVWNAQTGELLWTLYGEGGGPVAWSFDGKYLAGGHYAVKVWRLATRKELFSFKGHTAALLGVAFSPDGDRLISTANDKTVRIWDLKTGSWGQEAKSLVGAKGIIAEAIFSPNGRYVAGPCLDKVVRVWDLHSPSLQPAFTLSHDDRVQCAAFSPDGQQLASGSFDGMVKLWDLQTRRETATLRLGGWVYALAFSPDGKRLATASEDQTVKIWDLQRGHETFPLAGHATCLTFSRDGRKLVGGGGDKTVIIWDTATWQPVLTLPGHTSQVSSVAISSNGKLIASGSHDRSVKIWDAESGDLLFTLEGHTEPVHSVAFNPDGTRLASGGGDGTRVWDVGLGQQAVAFKGYCNSVSFSPDGGRLAAACGADGTVRIWDATPPQAKELEFPGRTPEVPEPGPLATDELRRFIGHTGGVTSVTLSGQHALSAGFDRTVRLWDVEKGEELKCFTDHPDTVWAVALSPDGRYAVSGGQDYLRHKDQDLRIRLWDVKERREVRTLTGHQQVISSLAFSKDSRQVISGCWDRTIRIWEIEGKKQPIIFQLAVPILSFAVSPDERRILVGSNDGFLRVIDRDKGQELHKFQGPEGFVESVAFSPDGRFALSGGTDRTIQLYDLKAGKEVRRLRGHAGKVDCVAFSPDGKRILSCGEDKTIRLWDAASDKELHCFWGHLGKVRSVALSAEGRHFISGSYDKTVRLWKLPE